MNDSIYDTIRSAKYISIFLLMVIFPNETVMPLVGYAAANGHLSLGGAILAGAAGSTLGSTLVYVLARQLPDPVFERLVHKFGRWLGLTPRSVNKAGLWFDRHARWTVLLARFVPGIRTAISVPAGLRRMPPGSFVLYTAIGSTACSGLLAYLGYTARGRIEEIQVLVTSISTFIYLLLITLVAAFVFWRLQRRR